MGASLLCFGQPVLASEEPVRHVAPAVQNETTHRWSGSMHPDEGAGVWKQSQQWAREQAQIQLQRLGPPRVWVSEVQAGTREGRILAPRMQRPVQETRSRATRATRSLDPKLAAPQ